MAYWNVRTLILAAMAIAAAGCVPSRPDYWNDAKWMQRFYVYDMDIRYPQVSGYDGWPTGTATVGFDYEDGVIKNVTLVKSSGVEVLDQAILYWLPRSRTSDAVNRSKRVFHHFQLDVTLKPGIEDYASTLRDSIVRQVTTAPELRSAAISSKPPNLQRVTFFVVDGKITNARTQSSSGDFNVDALGIAEIMKATPPPPPGNLKINAVPFSVALCYMADGRCH